MTIQLALYSFSAGPTAEISPRRTTHDHRNTVAMVTRNTKNADKHVGRRKDQNILPEQDV